IFGSIVALFVLSFLNALLPALTAIARPALVAILFAQPFLVMRLIAQMHPLRSRVLWVTFAGAAISWAAVIVLPAVLPDLKSYGTVVAVTWFFAVEVAAAARFAIDSRRRYGVARLRLASAAIGTGLFGAAILLAGLTGIARAPGASSSDST